MAAAKGKVKKAGTRKRREKKNIERGAVHIQFLLQQHDGYHH